MPKNNDKKFIEIENLQIFEGQIIKAFGKVGRLKYVPVNELQGVFYVEWYGAQGATPLKNIPEFEVLIKQNFVCVKID